MLLDAARREVRWMCGFDTEESDVDAFVDALIKARAAAQATGHTSIPGEATEQGPVTDRRLEPGPVVEDHSPRTDNQSGTVR